jgi:hypothetical protein
MFKSYQRNKQTKQILERIAKLWQVEAYRMRWSDKSSDHIAGFDWWPGDFCVRVRAAAPPSGSADPAVKISISTDFLRAVDLVADRFIVGVAAMSLRATSTYAWVYPTKSFVDAGPPGSGSPALWFNASTYVRDDVAGWMPEFFAQMSIVQPINAQIQASTTPRFLGSGSPDMSRLDSCKNAPLDGTLDVIEQVYAPSGKQPSRFANTDEFEQFAESFGRSDACFGLGDKTGLTLETPFGIDSALIKLSTKESHPQLGSGLLATLQLPYSGDESTIAEQVGEFNLLETHLWTGFPQLGCWHLAESRGGVAPAFTLFVPNALYLPGIATNVALWFLSRARWIREQRFPDLVDSTMADILNTRMLANQADAFAYPLDVASEDEEEEEEEEERKAFDRHRRKHIYRPLPPKREKDRS